MSRSMTSSFFPDINVWIALQHQSHRHHRSAVSWFRSLDKNEELIFCRHTQIGMLRLLTTEAVMGHETLNQRQCWALYMHWIAGGRAFLQGEPVGIDQAFQALTSADSPSPKAWADAYLAAFAECAGLTLVTFDQALAGRMKGAVLLG